MTQLLTGNGRRTDGHIGSPLLTLGLHHEQQHQELMVTDIKHVFLREPALPGLPPTTRCARRADPSAIEWIPFEEGLREVGWDG